MMNEKQLKYTGLIISIILAVTTIVNMSVTTYVLWNDRQTASMSPNSLESINIAMEVDIGRPSPLTFLFSRWQNWFSSYLVGGSAVETATVDLTIQVTGSNVASTASVDYYIEAKDTEGSGTSYRFLAGNGSSVSVGGASLNVDDDRSITSHLSQMGLSTSETWTIDYYVYVIATVQGAVSGETLTSEIAYTKFDTVTYTYDDPGQWSSGDWTLSNGGYAGYVKHNVPNNYDIDSPSDYMEIGQTSSEQASGWISYDINDQSNPPPRGAIIQEAYIEFSPRNTVTAQDILIAAYDDTYWSSNSINDYTGWTSAWAQRTFANVTWVRSGYQYEGNWCNTSNIAPVVEEIVARSDYYTTTGRMCYFFHYTADTGSDMPELRVFSAYNRPVLYIRWTTYSASWYDIPPLSVVDMPITLEVGAILVTAVVAVYILTDIRRRKNDEST